MSTVTDKATGVNSGIFAGVLIGIIGLGQNVVFEPSTILKSIVNAVILCAWNWYCAHC